MFRDDEYASISPEAKAILKTSQPQPYPSPLTAEEAVRLRQALNEERADLIAGVQARLIASVEERAYSGVPVAALIPKSWDATISGNRYAVYLHGGAYMLGIAADALGMLLADALGLPVYSVDYSLSPEAVFPQALEETVAAWSALANEQGGNAVMIGMSAGGTLALSTTQLLRERGLSLPKALGLLTSWVDLTRTGDSLYANERRDPVILWRNQLDLAAQNYLAGASVADPLISPIHAQYDLSFPPSMITTGTRDLFLSLCVRLYWRLKRDGASTELRVWEGAWHTFMAAPHVPEAAEARRELADFLLSHLEDTG